MRRALAWASAVLGAAALTRRRLHARQQASPPRGEVLDLPDGPTHVITAGPVDAPPVLLIHGSDGVALDWPMSPLWEALTPHARLIAPDRPGHGYTPAAPGTPVTIALNVRRAVQLLDALGPGPVAGPVTVVGHSYGAAVALALAEAHPERVRALVLLAPLSHPDAGTRRLLAYAPLVPGLEALLTRVLVLPVGRVVAWIEGRRAFSPQPMPRAWYRMMLTFSRRREQVLALAWENRSLRRELRALAPGYPALRLPVWILAAARDRLAPPGGHARRLAAELPGAHLTEFADGGHQLHWTHPVEVAAAVRGALHPSTPGQDAPNLGRPGAGDRGGPG